MYVLLRCCLDPQGPVFGEQGPNEDADGNGQKFVFILRFPGQQYDNETKLHYNYFRDYEPATGRYVESDPIGLRGGVSTFGYSHQQPATLFDTYGLSSCKDCDAKKCCQTAYEQSNDPSLGGAVVCCCESKIGCAWIGDDPKGPQDPDARRLLRACALKHERRHRTDTESCDGRPDGFRPD